MDPKSPTGFETQKSTPETITVIGREMPKARDMYDSLSDDEDILVYSNAESSLRRGHETALVSERELFDDLLDFCDRCRNLPTEEGDDAFGYTRAIASIDMFLDSMTYLSKEMYAEAIRGLAARHSEWLSRDPQNRLLFAIPDSRVQKSQGAVAHDVSSELDQSISNQALTTYVSQITAEELLDKNTKVVLCDDWVVSGNHIANDLSQVLQRAQAVNVSPQMVQIEVNLLLARTDQINEGIHTIQRLQEDSPQLMTNEPQIVTYFEAPVSKQPFDEQASPTGSHSATDYGFSETLSAMLTVAARQGVATRMPYIAEIIPKYSSDYKDKHIDK